MTVAPAPVLADPKIAAQGSVHAVILNYGTPELTIGAIECLLASSGLPGDLEVVVVDNASPDDSVARIAGRFPDLRVLRASSNLGFASGNNLALREVLAALPHGTDRLDTYVLLINSDTEVEPNALALCVQFLREHPDVGIVGPKVVLRDGSLDLACRRGFPTPANAFWKLTGLARRFPDNPRFAGYNLTHLDEDATAEVDSVMGAFMLVRLAAIDDAGLLDEAFFMYGEDLDWAYRIKAHGWRVYYYPRARVRHLKGATSRRQSRRMILEFYRAMWLFHRKHYAPTSPFLLNCLVAIGIALRGCLALGLNALRPADRRRVA